jgi:VanZ family protein
MRSIAQSAQKPWIQWIPALLWIGLIVVESIDLLSPKHTGHYLALVLTTFRIHLAQQKILHLNLMLRKFGHFVGYGILSWFLFRAWRATLRAVSSAWMFRWAALAVLSTALVASADEWHQTTLPSRHGSIKDVLLDSSGAIVAQCLLFFA